MQLIFNFFNVGAICIYSRFGERNTCYPMSNLVINVKVISLHCIIMHGFLKLAFLAFIHLLHNACTSFTTCMQSSCILDPLLLLDVFKVAFFGSTLLNTYTIDTSIMNLYLWTPWPPLRSQSPMHIKDCH